jgi:hypothetical protein
VTDRFELYCIIATCVPGAKKQARRILNDAPAYSFTCACSHKTPIPPILHFTMSSGVDQLPRTLHLASSPIRDTIGAGEFYLSTLRAVLVHMYVQMAKAVRNMYFYPLRTLHKQRTALTMDPTSCSPCIMTRRRNMTRSWPRTGGRTRKASCS